MVPRMSSCPWVELSLEGKRREHAVRGIERYRGEDIPFSRRDRCVPASGVYSADCRNIDEFAAHMSSEAGHSVV